MPDLFVFDAYALLALFAEETGADAVAAILNDPLSPMHSRLLWRASFPLRS